MSNYAYQQYQMARLAMKEAEKVKKRIQRIFLEDAHLNDGVRGPADTCFCKGCGYTDCDNCEHSKGGY